MNIRGVRCLRECLPRPPRRCEPNKVYWHGCSSGNDLSFTKDSRYVEMGQAFFNSIVKYCRTDAAYAALSDVETKAKADRMESFFLAETLKYLYLLFAQSDTLDLTKVVFNTEAHPMTRTW